MEPTTNHQSSNHLSSNRSERLIELFEQAGQIEPARRADFLAEACGDDEGMRRELESLLGYANDSAAGLPTSAIKLAARQLAGAAGRDWAGQQVGHYRILRLLGVGGMGEVWLAEDTRLDRQVAIKFLTARLVANPALLGRFEREARAASALNHPNILVVHEIGQHEEDRFIVTEFIEGQTPRQRLAQTRLTVKETIEIAVQVAGALKAAHSAKIFHRDIKPENIMLRDDGVVKVLDFGIAKLGGATGAVPGAVATGLLPIDAPHDHTRSLPLPVLHQRAPNLTAAGVILGTASYMSPEQARGDEVDGRSDLFALGAVMYEMAMGERLFAGASPIEVTEQLLRPQEPLPAAAKFSSKAKLLEPIIRKCLRRKREERYAAAAELLSELQRLKRQIETRFIRRVVAAVSLLAALAMVVLGLVIPASIREEWVETQMRDGHTNAVRQLAIAPDGKKLVSTGYDAKIIVWDFATRMRLATLTHDDKNPVSAVAFAPDSRVFATSCADGTVNVWDAETYAKLAVVGGHKGDVKRIAFSPDGRWLLTATGGGEHTIWETGSWRTVQGLYGVGLGGGGLPVISPDSRYLLAHSWAIWDLIKGVALTKEQPPAWYWSALAPDATRLVTAENSGFVTFWDVHQFWPSGQKRLIKREQAHRERAFAAAYSPDGRYVATGGETIILWDARTQTKLARFPYPERPWYLEFTPDSQALVACYGDAQLLVWDIAEREQKASFVGHSHPVRAVAYAPDGKLIASAGDDQSIILWDAAAGRKKAVLSAHRTRISALEFFRDGQRLISTDLHGEPIVWEVNTGRASLRFTKPTLKESHFGYAVSLSPNQQWIATSYGVHASADGRVAAMFTAKDQPLAPEFYGVQFSPDGRWLVGVNPGSQVCLWDTTDWNLRQRAGANQKDRANLISVAFSPDSRSLVTGEDQGNLRLWQVEPLREVAVLGQHKTYIRSVAFSHDGRFIASASDDKTLKLWDVARRKEVAQVGLHTSPVLAVAFSPDDQQLVSGDYDNLVRAYTRRRTLWGWQWAWLDRLPLLK